MTELKSNKKYILYPDYVISDDDGDLHYIDANNLAKLYKVNISECFISDNGKIPFGLENYSYMFIHLHPRVINLKEEMNVI